MFQAEDGIRDRLVTGVQTCALRSAVVAGSISIVMGVDGNPIIAYTDATRDAWELDRKTSCRERV